MSPINLLHLLSYFRKCWLVIIIAVVVIIHADKSVYCLGWLVADPQYLISSNLFERVKLMKMKKGN